MKLDPGTSSREGTEFREVFRAGEECIGTRQRKLGDGTLVLHTGD